MSVKVKGGKRSGNVTSITSAAKVHSTKGVGYTACHTSHKILTLGAGQLLGASCSYPRDGFDVYIGFDGSMDLRHSAYPWEKSKDSVVEFMFRISDGAAPKDIDGFLAMVNWVCSQLQEGKKIHAGCIGGHGRTGTFIAAVVAKLLGEKDAIAWVREHHCKKAVESTEQVNFLVKHYGVTKQAPSKAPVTKGYAYKYYDYDLGGTQGQLGLLANQSSGTQASALSYLEDQDPVGGSQRDSVVRPTKSSICIW